MYSHCSFLSSVNQFFAPTMPNGGYEGQGDPFLANRAWKASVGATGFTREQERAVQCLKPYFGSSDRRREW